MVNTPPSVTRFTDVSLDAIHHSLRASRRRLIISSLAHHYLTHTQAKTQSSPTELDSTVSVRELSRAIVTIEEGVPIEHATGAPYHNVYTSLIQTHLPELDDVGAIEYNSSRKVVRPDDNLVALAIVANISSPVVKLLFHPPVMKSETPVKHD